MQFSSFPLSIRFLFALGLHVTLYSYLSLSAQNAGGVLRKSTAYRRSEQ